MLKVIIYSAVYFLAAYGFLKLFGAAAEGMHRIGGRKLQVPYTVIAVKNREEDIETLIRSEAWRMLCGNEDCRVGDMVVIDLESEDATMPILKRLSREYAFLHPMTRDRYIEMIQSL